MVTALPRGPGNDPPRLKQAAHALLRCVQTERRPLIVFPDHATVWLWLPLPGNAQLDAEATAELLRAEHPHVRVALGEPARGAGGSVASHRHAAAVALRDG
jgi:hypothetical protein